MHRLLADLAHAEYYFGEAALSRSEIGASLAAIRQRRRSWDHAKRCLGAVLFAADDVRDRIGVPREYRA